MLCAKKSPVLFLLLLIGFFLFPSPAFASINSLNSLVEYTGENDSVSFGLASSAGDINGDGYTDTVVASVYYPSSTYKKGRVYVFYGGSTPTSTTANNADIILTGENNNDRFGHSVNVAGDVNGDGYKDIITGAPRYPGNLYLGRAYIFYGGPALSSTTADKADVIFSGEGVLGDHYNVFGVSVSAAGDLNRDGCDDILIGSVAPLNNTDGRTYVFYGSSTLTSKNASEADIKLTGRTDRSDEFGTTVAPAGDVNNDGYPDILVGSYYYSEDGKEDPGAAWIFYGGPTLTSTTADNADVILIGENDNDIFGTFSIATGGDVNNDGYADVIVGAYTAEANKGRAYIFYGGPNLTSTTADNADVILTGENNDDFFGTEVSSAGDMNNDGYADVIVGATGHSGGGRAYIFYGAPNLTSTTADNADVILSGKNNGDHFGSNLSPAGDVNNDGYVDVIVGAYNYLGGTMKGRSYLYNLNYNGFSLTADSFTNTNDSTPIVNGTATVAGSNSSTISKVQWSFNNSYTGTWTDCTANDGSFNTVSEGFACGISAVGLSEGGYTVYIRILDSNRVYQAAPSFFTFDFGEDRSGPLISWTNTSGASRIFEPIQTDYLYISEYLPSFTFTQSSDTRSGIQKYQILLSGNNFSDRVYLDNILPDKPDNSNPSERNEADKYVRYQCDQILVHSLLDKDRLADGGYKWKVRAIDRSGNSTDTEEKVLLINNYQAVFSGTFFPLTVLTLGGVQTNISTLNQINPSFLSLTNQQPIFYGIAPVNAVVKLSLRQEKDQTIPILTQTTTANPDSRFGINLNKPLPFGNYLVSLSATKEGDYVQIPEFVLEIGSSRVAVIQPETTPILTPTPTPTESYPLIEKTAEQMVVKVSPIPTPDPNPTKDVPKKCFLFWCW